MTVLRWLGFALLLALAGLAVFVADAVWNGSGLFYAALGRDELVDMCTPPAREALARRGFSPTDLTFGDRPSIAITGGTAGAARTLTDAFTFSDGPDGPRVDGRLVCVVAGKSVRVDVDVEGLPMRAA